MSMFNISLFKKSIGDFAAQLRAVRRQIEELQQLRENVTNAPSTREDVKSMVAAWAARKSDEYILRLRFNMGRFVTNAMALQDPAEVERGMTLYGKTRQLGGAHTMFPGPELEDMAICCLLGPQIVKTLHAAIDAMDWPSNSQPLADRARKISDIDARLSKLIQEEQDLVSAAAEHGVQIG